MFNLQANSLLLSPITSRLILGASLLSLTSCAALKQTKLKDTEVFYRASTMDSFVPKPNEVPIPTLTTIPARSKVIGHFAYTTPKGSQFAMDAAIYNARRVGADAVVVRKLEEKTTPYSYYVAPETISVPKTRMITQPIWIRDRNGVPGHWEPRQRVETFYVLEQRPGHVVSGTNHRTTIDAVMIRQK
ncbi:MAG: hypothetical protein WCO60_15675 [Verrucomicrobiota bacterium]